MPNLIETIFRDPTPTQIIRIIAYKSKAPTVEINRVEYNPPHVMPRVAMIFVPTYEVYIVRIYLTPDSGSVGTLVSEYTATPSLSVPYIIPDIEMLVGGTNGQDPADGAGFKIIPGTEDYTISRFIKLGVGPLPADQWQQIAGFDDDGNPAIGVELLGNDSEGNPIVFYEGERFTLQFDPMLDGNGASAIAELSDTLDNHLQDYENPHQVTKTQVGLSNIPNAKSDAINLGDSNTLATSKAVDDLRQSITNTIIFIGSYNVGTVGAQNHKLVTITHNQGLIPANYRVIGTIRGVSGTAQNDDHIVGVTRELSANDFKLQLVNTANSNGSVFYDYMLIKI